MKTQTIQHIETSHMQTPDCYHCGLTCKDTSISTSSPTSENPLYFCCEGCKSVYEILEGNGLCTYYQLKEGEEHLSVNTFFADQYDFLDLPEVRHKLIDFSDDQQTKITFSIPNMHCTACIWLLENLRKIQPAVLQSKVNFIKKELYVQFHESQLSLKSLVQMLAQIGYEPSINLNSLSEKQTEAVGLGKVFYYKLGIAGFCFGNIMLLSFPEYLGLDKTFDADFHQFFGYLNLGLAMPVVAYSASNYFQSAWNGIRRGNLPIDVPISLGILSLLLQSMLEIISQSGAGYLDSLAGLIFFLLIGRWFQQKTYGRISFERDYQSYFPIAAIRREEGIEKSVPIDQLQENDLIVVRSQSLIPADGILWKGEARIDYSFVTGEAEAVKVEAGKTIFAGGRQLGQAIELKLTKKVSQSYLTQLWNNSAFDKDYTTTKEEQSLSLLADKIVPFFTPTILLIASIAGLYWWSVVGFAKAVQIFAAVLIIACPCALALATPFTLGNALRILGRMGFYVRNTAVVEHLAAIDHIVFDKTGTITQSQNNAVLYVGKPLTVNEKQMIRTLTRQSAHPISRQICESLQQDAPILELAIFGESAGKGIEGEIEGQRLKIGNAAFVGEAVYDLFSPNETHAFVSFNGETKGYYSFSNAYREGLKEVIEGLQKGHQISVISGDKDTERTNLQQLFGKDAVLLFEQSPQNKLDYIEALQQKGQRVVMIGDGLNDAGALQQANVGIAVSENINNFSPACDVIVEAKRFGQLVDFVTYSEEVVKVVKGAFVLSFLYNFIGIGFAVQGFLSPIVAAILMPLSSITVVVFGVGVSYFKSNVLNRDSI
ncbi:MAG: heavy metal translocating P-type ATPase metal-binding domain-containing protein [Chitinophagales bacterium]